MVAAVPALHDRITQEATASKLEARVSPGKVVTWIADKLIENGLPRAERPEGVWLDKATIAKPVRGTEASVQALVRDLERHSPVDQVSSSRKKSLPQS